VSAAAQPAGSPYLLSLPLSLLPAPVPPDLASLRGDQRSVVQQMPRLHAFNHHSADYANPVSYFLQALVVNEFESDNWGGPAPVGSSAATAGEYYMQQRGEAGSFPGRSPSTAACLHASHHAGQRPSASQTACRRAPSHG
jgi:hypothetical protein